MHRYSLPDLQCAAESFAHDPICYAAVSRVAILGSDAGILPCDHRSSSKGGIVVPRNDNRRGDVSNIADAVEAVDGGLGVRTLKEID